MMRERQQSNYAAEKFTNRFELEMNKHVENLNKFAPICFNSKNKTQNKTFESY